MMRPRIDIAVEEEEEGKRIEPSQRPQGPQHGACTMTTQTQTQTPTTTTSDTNSIIINTDDPRHQENDRVLLLQHITTTQHVVQITGLLRQQHSPEQRVVTGPAPRRNTFLRREATPRAIREVVAAAAAGVLLVRGGRTLRRRWIWVEQLG